MKASANTNTGCYAILANIGQYPIPVLFKPHTFYTKSIRILCFYKTSFFDTVNKSVDSMCIHAAQTCPRTQPNLALQASPQYHDNPTNCSWLWLHAIRSPCIEYWPPVTTICFKIWNPIFVVSAMHDTGWLKAVCVDTANRFHLALYDIINYNDVTSATNSYVFVMNVYFTDVQTVNFF